MKLSRRELITGSLAMGISTILGGRLVAAESGKPRAFDLDARILLVLQQAHSPELLRALRLGPGGFPAHLRVWYLGADQVLDPRELQQRLAAIHATHVLGVLDACNHCLLLETVRERAGAVLDEATLTIDRGLKLQSLLAEFR